MHRLKILKALILLLVVGGTACVAQVQVANGTNAGTNRNQDDVQTLSRPEITAVNLNGRRLKVVATTSIIGDVVAQVGGEAIELTTLMGPGQDPHGYEPSARDLTAAADADVIIINGWDLEEGLISTLQDLAGHAVLVPISYKIIPLKSGQNQGERDSHEMRQVDPHTWLDPKNVLQWAANLNEILTGLDPANAALYAANFDGYREELANLIDEIDAKLEAVPADGRLLVTNHDSLAYFAAAYQFKIIGSVIPAASTLAEPSAGSLTELVSVMTDAGICSIFSESTANDKLAQAVAAELENCSKVNVISLYTGAVGPVGSGADSYIGMMQANVNAIVEGLK